MELARESLNAMVLGPLDDVFNQWYRIPQSAAQPIRVEPVRRDRMSSEQDSDETCRTNDNGLLSREDEWISGRLKMIEAARRVSDAFNGTEEGRQIEQQRRDAAAEKLRNMFHATGNYIADYCSRLDAILTQRIRFILPRSISDDSTTLFGRLRNSESLGRPADSGERRVIRPEEVLELWNNNTGRRFEQYVVAHTRVTEMANELMLATRL